MRLALLSMFVAGVLATLPAAAHEGHDHGAPTPAVGMSVAPRTSATSPDLELVAVARGSELEIALDRFASNEPVTDATIEIDTPSGLLKASHRGNGLYVATAPFVAKPGDYDLAVTVTAGDLVDVLVARLTVPNATPQAVAVPTSGWLSRAVSLPVAVGAMALAFVVGLLIPRKRTAAAALVALGALATGDVVQAQTAEAALITSPPAVQARDAAQRLGDGSVFVPKTTQRILSLRTILTKEAAHARSVELPGRIVPDPNASGLVQASVGGRLLPPEGGFKPLGKTVKAGEVLAYIRPPLPAADATVQAQQARELDQQIAIITKRAERYRTLAPSGAVARSQLDETELELKGLQERRANLERVNRTPEALVAPVSGTIALSNATAGQMADPSTIIFQIIEPTKLWVEALAFEPQQLTAEASARLSDGRDLKLSYLGTGLADRNQAIPVQFAIDGGAEGLRTGQFVTVFAKTTETRSGIALPRSAVLRGANGLSVVYVHTGAEQFTPRDVRTVGLDGEKVLVVSGLEAGARVVTQGAELLDQIR